MIVTDRRNPAGASVSSEELSRARLRYMAGEPRGTIFRDLVLDSMRSMPHDAVAVLDIGCGHGFDGDSELQHSIAQNADPFLGIEPDAEIATPDFAYVYRGLLEDIALEPCSVHVAYSTFVLEHVSDPARFFRKLHECLVPGGIFWGFTVDARHPFCLASTILHKLRLKDRYLDLLRGTRGAERYENYPTFYRANSPRRISAHAAAFRRTDFLSVHRVGQLRYYFPRVMWPLLHLAEATTIKLALPGSVLMVRLEK